MSAQGKQYLHTLEESEFTTMKKSFSTSKNKVSNLKGLSM